ncbi:ParB/RepB/Spo0J family partition protein [Streptomyces sp. NPDC086783]|uniref:ParB/RepB/Spo0J family partition protein n=1 Tax=Streptomyces sp. NPDC086783 TaxID=3365758 RepID=UPI003802918B
MSVADRLGTGSSFSEARRTRSARGRAKAVTQGDVPAYELVRLRLDEVSPTPLNPRRNFGSDEDKTRFGEELRTVQLAACVAVSRSAYLALWPTHEDRIGSAAHVLVNGERRFRSAVHVGLDSLDFVVRDDLASSREGFINHLLQENLEREDFDVIERARGVQALVTVCAEKAERGAKARAAERLGKDRSWVTNQLTLLDLPMEIQAMLSSGELPERDGRFLARHCRENPGMEAAALLDYLKEMKAVAARKRAEELEILQAARAASGSPAEASSLSADSKAVPSEATLEVVKPLQSQSSLSADNESDSSEDSSEVSSEATSEGTLLSADSKAVPSEATLEVVKPLQSQSSLSADNESDSSEDSSEVSSDATSEDTLLSADNTIGQTASASASKAVLGQQGTGKAEPGSIVLGEPRQIAEELVRRLTSERLIELTELLKEHVGAGATA